MSEPRHSLESHSIRIHPKLWQWAKSRAEELGYQGGASALISGLILYDCATRRPHWLTREVMNHPEELETILAEIESDNPLATKPTFFEVRLRQIAGIYEQTKPNGNP